MQSLHHFFLWHLFLTVPASAQQGLSAFKFRNFFGATKKPGCSQQFAMKLTRKTLKFFGLEIPYTTGDHLEGKCRWKLVVSINCYAVNLWFGARCFAIRIGVPLSKTITFFVGTIAQICFFGGLVQLSPACPALKTYRGWIPATFRMNSRLHASHWQLHLGERAKLGGL